MNATCRSEGLGPCEPHFPLDSTRMTHRGLHLVAERHESFYQKEWENMLLSTSVVIYHADGITIPASGLDRYRERETKY